MIRGAAAIWQEKRYQRRHDGSFEEKWTFETDWKPFPVFLWEPMFQPALHGPLMYVPGAGGSVWQVLTVLDRPNALQRINPAHPNGFEWCVNAPAVDAGGNVYANAEDGYVYQIGQGGVLKTQTFLNQALGAAYTPVSLDPAGRVERSTTASSRCSAGERYDAGAGFGLNS